MMGKHAGHYLRRLSETYGPIFSIYVGRQLVVVLNDLHSVRDAFLKQGNLTSLRPTTYLLHLCFASNKGVYHGIMVTNGKLWREQRKFAQSKLREFGMGKVSIEKKIQEEASACIAHLRDTDGKTFDPRTLLTASIVNVIASVIFGKRYELEDPAFVQLISNVDVVALEMRPNSVLHFFDWLRHLPPMRQGVSRLKTALRIISAEMRRNIIIHKQRHQVAPLSTPADFIDAYLDRAAQDRDRGYADSTFTEFQLLKTLQDLLAAGSHTVITTLRWGLLFMLKYPRVMHKVQAEIDDVIGRGRLPCMADEDKMPYTEATIAEVQRVGDVIPITPHEVLHDMEQGGYSIPAGTMLIANLTAILNDPKYFPEPEKFSPERHLDENGHFVRHEASIPYCIGTRVCMGESLARMELFVFFTSILQNFAIELPDGVTEPCIDGDFGFVHMAKPYELRCVARD
ncbi:PREDICTED: cytochrome P450 2C15-like [Priapulus caudatus]|uniref:Cytochrome P450 2C15-like n=1 Tax=Priapulus caudatus TaxID=37621 RepID=A0ABM1EDJ1_PRICU|nr:PREDICTED: cytochrome P450 2C15-like [Priapulus caudatus]